MPYEQIEEVDYMKMISKINAVDFKSSLIYDETVQLNHGPVCAFCDADGLVLLTQ